MVSPARACRTPSVPEILLASNACMGCPMSRKRWLVKSTMGWMLRCPTASICASMSAGVSCSVMFSTLITVYRSQCVVLMQSVLRAKVYGSGK